MTASPEPRTEFFAGLAIAAFGGTVAALAAANYPLGTATRMGSGAMPTLLGALLALLGLAIAARAAIVGGGARLDLASGLRPLAGVLGAVVVFALAVRPLGLVAAGALAVVFAACGSREARWREVVPLAAGVSLAAALLFVEVLGLPYGLWP